MLLHARQISRCHLGQLLVQLHAKIHLHQFQSLHVQLLLKTEGGLIGIDLGNFLGAVYDAACVNWPSHGQRGTDTAVVHPNFGLIRYGGYAFLHSLCGRIF